MENIRHIVAVFGLLIIGLVLVSETLDLHQSNQSEICGDFIVGSPDPIFLQPTSPTGVQQTSTTPQIGIPPLPFYAPPPPPPVPAPTSKTNQALIYGGVLGALLVAGALVEKKLR